MTQSFVNDKLAQIRYQVSTRISFSSLLLPDPTTEEESISSEQQQAGTKITTRQYIVSLSRTDEVWAHVESSSSSRATNTRTLQVLQSDQASNDPASLVLVRAASRERHIHARVVDGTASSNVSVQLLQSGVSRRTARRAEYGLTLMNSSLAGGQAQGILMG